MTATSSPVAATVTALRQAEAGVVATLHGVADVLDRVGTNPVQAAVDRVRHSAEDAQARLAAAMTDLRTILGDFVEDVVGMSNALTIDIEASQDVDLEAGVRVALTGPAPVLPATIQERIDLQLPKPTHLYPGSNGCVPQSTEPDTVVVRDEDAQSTFDEAEAAEIPCACCGSKTGKPDSCSRCKLEMCSECISDDNEIGPVCGQCKDELDYAAQMNRMEGQEAPTKPKRKAKKRK